MLKLGKLGLSSDAYDLYERLGIMRMNQSEIMYQMRWSASRMIKALDELLLNDMLYTDEVSAYNIKKEKSL